MKRIGITGSIGSGKSAATNYLISKGFTVIDGDALVAQIYYDKSFIAEMTNNFGENVLREDKINLDKGKIREIVFRSKDRLEELNKIIEPYIKEYLLEARILHQEEEIVFFDLPLLFEKNMQREYDSVIMVYCRDSIRYKRAALRDNKSVEEIKRIDKHQMPQEIKKKLADIVLDNSQEISNLYKQIDEALKMLGVT